MRIIDIPTEQIIDPSNWLRRTDDMPDNMIIGIDLAAHGMDVMAETVWERGADGKPRLVKSGIIHPKY